jgi:site-specific DNA recombinase
MKTALYARVSSDKQDTDLSLSAQLRALREYAQRNGYQVVREFIDEAESGRTAARPAFREMIALAKTKQAPFEAILVWKLNRFARSRVDSITYKALLRSKGIQVISINEPLDNSPSGQLLEGVIESIDEFYSANLGQDIKRGMRENASRGFFNGSRPPYGFCKVAVRDGTKTRNKLEPEPEGSVAVQVVRRIFDMAMKNTGCKEIAKTLNRDGFRTISGMRWGKTTIHKILTNEAYCGTLVWGGRPGHPAIHSVDPPVRVENAWPSIVDRKVFQLVQKKMASNAPQAVHPRTVPSFYLLSGLLFCSCGHAMIGRSAKSHQYYYYMCNGSFKQGKDACDARALPKDKLEQLVIGQIKENILNQEWLEELVVLVNKELSANNDTLKDKLEAIDAELNDVRNRLSKLYDALETGKFTLDDLAPRIKELRVRQDELSKTGLQLEAENIARGIRQVDVDTVKSYAEDLKNLLEEAEIAESKAFLRSFIKRIVINESEAVIHYSLPMPRGEQTQLVGVLPIDTPGGPKMIFPHWTAPSPSLASSSQVKLIPHFIRIVLRSSEGYILTSSLLMTSCLSSKVAPFRFLSARALKSRRRISMSVVLSPSPASWRSRSISCSVLVIAS